MKYKIYFLVLLNLVLTNPVKSQEEIEHNAPTLQLGLNGLSFSRGDLDAQLIMEIIAEKQGEIKTKMVQTMFLDHLKGSGATVYMYASNMLKVITEEPNPEVRTRLALENTVNLVFTYAFADYFLRKNYDMPNLKELACAYGLTKKELKNGLKLKETKETYKLPIPKWKFRKYKGIRKKNINTNTINSIEKFRVLILDMCSKVIRDNQKLKELGLMRSTYSSTFDYLNEYYILRRDSLIKMEKNTSREKKKKELNNVRCIINAKCENSNSIITLMTRDLNDLIEIIGVLNVFKNKIGFKKNIISKVTNQTKTLDNIDFHVTLDCLINEVDTTIELLTNRNPKGRKFDSLIYNDIEQLIQCRELLVKAQKVSDFRGISDALFILNSKILPVLNKQVKNDFNLYTGIKQLNEAIDYKMLLELSDTTKYRVLLEQPYFVNLLATMYEFNKAETYSDYISLISDLEGLFENQKIKAVFSVLNTYVKNNISISKDENNKEFVNFDIENFLFKLNNTSMNKIRRWQFHFTVGVNNISFPDGLTLSDNSVLKSYSFVSEKIGVKWKFKNTAAWSSLNYGAIYDGSWGFKYVKTSPPREPVVSNLHLLLYGSGILYNLTPTGTNREFNYPLIGIGLGMTFYNSLDFNVSLGFPIRTENNFYQNMTSRKYFGFGFDIQFGEYMNRLAQKRKNHVTQKRLAEVRN